MGGSKNYDIVIPAFASVAKPMQESHVLAVWEIPANAGMTVFRTTLNINLSSLSELPSS